MDKLNLPKIPTSGKYILQGKVPVEVFDLLEWAAQHESAQRIVAQDKIGKTLVSTVFLGIDHSFGGGPPLLFETMIFPNHGNKPSKNLIGDKRFMESYMERYSTWDQAEAGHKRAVEGVYYKMKTANKKTRKALPKATKG